MFSGLWKLACYFERFAALRWDEDKHKWIPEKFKKLQPFEDYPSENLVKEFEQHGLKDFEEEIDNSSKRVEIAETLRYVLVFRLEDVLLKIQQKFSSDNPKLRTKQQLAVEHLQNIVKELKNATLEETVESMLTLSQTVKFGRTTFQPGASLFKMYEKIRAYIHINELGAVLPKLDEIDSFKEFSKTPEKVRIVFSTQIEDLAGAACRGINSCLNLFDYQQKFKGLNEHNKRLVGAILSKYVGIIYAATPESDYHGRGSKMMYRSLVRLIYNPTNEEWVILLDKMYPALNQDFLAAFKKVLSQHTDLQIAYVGEIKLDDFESPEYDEQGIPEEYRSYQDNPLRPSPDTLEQMASSDNVSERLRAAQFLPESSHILLDLLLDDDKNVRNEAFGRIDDYDWKDEIDNILMNLSEDLDPEKRITAIKFMSPNDLSHKRRLFEMLNEQDKNTAQYLVSTLVANYGLQELERYVISNSEKVNPSIKKQVLGRDG